LINLIVVFLQDYNDMVTYKQLIGKSYLRLTILWW